MSDELTGNLGDPRWGVRLRVALGLLASAALFTGLVWGGASLAGRQSSSIVRTSQGNASFSPTARLRTVPMQQATAPSTFHLQPNDQQSVLSAFLHTAAKCHGVHPAASAVSAMFVSDADPSVRLGEIALWLPHTDWPSPLKLTGCDDEQTRRLTRYIISARTISPMTVDGYRGYEENISGSLPFMHGSKIDLKKVDIDEMTVRVGDLQLFLSANAPAMTPGIHVEALTLLRQMIARAQTSAGGN